MKGINSYINTILGESEIIRSSGMVFGASLLGSIILFIANLILSKHFGPEGFGNFKTIISLFLLLPALIEFGAGVTLTRYIAQFSNKEEINYLVRWFLKLRIISYLLLLSIIFILREQVALYFLKDPSLAYLILPGIFLSGFIFFNIFKFISLGFQNFKLYSFSQFLTPASTGVLTIFFGYFFGVYYAIIGWGLGYLIGNLPNIRFSFTEKIFEKTRVIDVKKIFLGYSIPLHLMIIPGFLGIAVVPILSLFFSQRLIGYYAFAMIFYQGVLLIPAALFSVLLPKFSELEGSENLKEARTKLRKVFLTYTPIVVLGIIACLLFSELFLGIIAPTYLPGLILFKSLICFGLLVGYLLIYRSYLTGLAKMKKLTILVIIQNLSLLVISFIIVEMAS
ncbi:MAG: hypothetical protein B6U72_05835 [Candidatus Altiarchaeales archaeon ex4484_2]|nr:MAG: hypothetical protein B6U72_05835 [Candidatus Altiarchaeales archaeon ex4484_2]